MSELCGNDSSLPPPPPTGVTSEKALRRAHGKAMLPTSASAITDATTDVLTSSQRLPATLNNADSGTRPLAAELNHLLLSGVLPLQGHETEGARYSALILVQLAPHCDCGVQLQSAAVSHVYLPSLGWYVRSCVRACAFCLPCWVCQSLPLSA